MREIRVSLHGNRWADNRLTKGAAPFDPSPMHARSFEDHDTLLLGSWPPAGLIHAEVCGSMRYHPFRNTSNGVDVHRIHRSALALIQFSPGCLAFLRVRLNRRPGSLTAPCRVDCHRQIERAVDLSQGPSCDECVLHSFSTVSPSAPWWWSHSSATFAFVCQTDEEPNPAHG
jgi:hypothetical protein